MAYLVVWLFCLFLLIGLPRGAFFRGEYYTFHTYTTKINGGTHMIKIGLLNTEHESEFIWVKIIDYHHSEAFGQRFYITLCYIYVSDVRHIMVES